MTSTYRKKPIPVQARELTSDSYRGLIDALTAEQFVAGGEAADGTVYLEIRTLEGQLRAREGDWIVWGTHGDVWPVRGDIFAETYEPAIPLPAGFRSEQLVAVRCAACEYEYDEDESYTCYFNSVEQATTCVRDAGWTVLKDGRVLCTAEDDEDHDELRRTVGIATAS
ncbi:PGDYG domain-containing protein [Streptomyces neyagawaensis]|uniref:PGDYG domain-containing protein n=1 Tax=Streptomyces neyagawaensis TaxID=42238 RepID=UPI00201CD654|nr:PGDYG domain-containing protein [Streptomyces neyagawaensis]MCL6733325.1 PGDYG domain-containing protein [Streptomyces neyagawaensis]MDE1685128.1 PGDYG domain-containing protein [Streptomyces neyagawaensis]